MKSLNLKSYSTPPCHAYTPSAYEINSNDTSFPQKFLTSVNNCFYNEYFTQKICLRTQNRD